MRIGQAAARYWYAERGAGEAAERAGRRAGGGRDEPEQALRPPLPHRLLLRDPPHHQLRHCATHGQPGHFHFRYFQAVLRIRVHVFGPSGSGSFYF